MTQTREEIADEITRFVSRRDLLTRSDFVALADEIISRFLTAPELPRFVWSRVDPGDMDYWEVTLGFVRKDDAERFRASVTAAQSVP